MTAARNYIDGIWSEAGPDGIEMFDPATGEMIGTAPRSGKAEIDAAVDAAKRALPAWSAMPAPKRGEILFETARLHGSGAKEELGQLITREMGKVKVEALGDVQEAIDMAYYMAGEGRRLFGVTTPSELPDKICLTRARAGRRLRHDHALELPHRHPLLEEPAGAHLRQHRRPQAVGGDGRLCDTAYVECLIEAGPARRCGEHRARHAVRRPATRSSATRTCTCSP